MNVKYKMSFSFDDIEVIKIYLKRETILLSCSSNDIKEEMRYIVILFTCAYNYCILMLVFYVNIISLYALYAFNINNTIKSRIDTHYHINING